MFWPITEKFAFSPRDQRVLRQAEISYSGPGTILHDFDALLGYVREGSPQVTRGGQLPLRALPEINALLARPIELGLKRPVLKSFPHIEGLYLLLRASGLTYIDTTGRKPLLVVDEQVHQSWQRLNPGEQYGNLLEAWFLKGQPEIIGEQRGIGGLRVPDHFRQAAWFLARIPEDGLQVAGNAHVEDSMGYFPGMFNIGLLDLFGFIDVQRGAPEPGRGWRIARIARTRFGLALLALLLDQFFGDIGNIHKLEAEDEIPFGAFQPILQPYFPEWGNNLASPRWTPREGAHVFKVSLGRVWRRIAVAPDDVLDTLASAILDAFAFDWDHLYEFKYQGRTGAMEHVFHPYMDEGPWTPEVAVGDVPLLIGQAMTFVYDFGDWWEFAVTLERVDPGMDIDGPVVLEEHGEPPEQYPTWDEE
jgi:hypothetical protein